MDLYSVHLPLSEFGHEAVARLPEDFFAPLTTQELELVIAACIALDKASQGKKAPRPFQLKVMLSVVAGRDCIVRAATGSGKTLAMMLAHLVFPEDVVITVSPLKILQRAQVRYKLFQMLQFSDKYQHLQVDKFNAYGIRSIAVNEDTVLTAQLYQVRSNSN